MATFNIDNEFDKIYEQFFLKILHFWCTIENPNNLNDAKDIAKAIVFCQYFPILMMKIDNFVDQKVVIFFGHSLKNILFYSDKNIR